MLAQHVKSVPKVFLPQIMKQARFEIEYFNEEEKVREAQQQVVKFLEVLADKYAELVKKDKEKEIKFLESKFSPLADCLKKEGPLKVRDLLSIIQTSMLKVRTGING